MWTPLIYDFDRRLSMHKEGLKSAPSDLNPPATGPGRGRRAARRQNAAQMPAAGRSETVGDAVRPEPGKVVTSWWRRRAGERAWRDERRTAAARYLLSLAGPRPRARARRLGRQPEHLPHRASAGRWSARWRTAVAASHSCCGSCAPPRAPRGGRRGAHFQIVGTDPALEAAGKAYYEYRAALVVNNNEGMTKI